MHDAGQRNAAFDDQFVHELSLYVGPEKPGVAGWMEGAPRRGGCGAIRLWRKPYSLPKLPDGTQARSVCGSWGKDIRYYRVPWLVKEHIRARRVPRNAEIGKILRKGLTLMWL